MTDPSQPNARDIAEAFGELRQLVFNGLVASAHAATHSDDLEKAWEKFAENDARFLAVMDRIAPGVVKK